MLTKKFHKILALPAQIPTFDPLGIWPFRSLLQPLRLHGNLS